MKHRKPSQLPSLPAEIPYCSVSSALPDNIPTPFPSLPLHSTPLHSPKLIPAQPPPTQLVQSSVIALAPPQRPEHCSIPQQLHTPQPALFRLASIPLLSKGSSFQKGRRNAGARNPQPGMRLDLQGQRLKKHLGSADMEMGRQDCRCRRWKKSLLVGN